MGRFQAGHCYSISKINEILTVGIVNPISRISRTPGGHHYLIKRLQGGHHCIISRWAAGSQAGYIAGRAAPYLGSVLVLLLTLG